MKKLEGKVALITGGESGIGQSIAAEFAAQGADVIITYLADHEAAQRTYSVVEEHGCKCTMIQADVSDENSVASLFDQALVKHHDIHILVNSAGVRSADKFTHELSFEEFERTVRINLFGTFLICKRFVQHRLQAGGYGRVINISSIHEEVVSPGKTEYCASKAALRGFTRSLALEVADQQITVNNIAPGMILTPMNQRAMDDRPYREELEQRIPLKRSGTVEDVAKVAVFLASDDASYLTGTTQFVDGELMLNRAKGAR
ncbi:SDR family oxidoreductase [Mucilaginibacter daejeonensis]|uniref:SDR family NAD(P)-dependent oxidoreductase n=1 Tax=Mucilaginibacter daejeonensis TaxID=398049 RepID=UPI001D17B248|nr:SDR family NAD(P)-dependent oxidoreductase [Mucilaginibacter daejeonensis]UEG55281.1 SDR family oxidoreductase [Mucilaginibacter daejeonensis]